MKWFDQESLSPDEALRVDECDIHGGVAVRRDHGDVSGRAARRRTAPARHPSPTTGVDDPRPGYSGVAMVRRRDSCQAVGPGRRRASTCGGRENIAITEATCRW